MPRLLAALLLVACVVGSEPTPAVAAVAAAAGADEGGAAGSLVIIDADGSALSVAEALPEDDISTFTVLVPGRGLRQATIVRRAPDRGAVLLRIARVGDERLPVLTVASAAGLPSGVAVWTSGNGFRALELDGIAPLSRGVLAGRGLRRPDDEAPRGRGGRLLSRYHGPLLETDAAVNDGDQGGALLDAEGRLIGLLTLSWSEDRRLGAAIPIDHVLASLELPLPTRASVGVSDHFVQLTARVRQAQVLVQLHRPRGPGNPGGLPPPRATEGEVPPFQRAAIERAWEAWFHRRQVFYTDQPVPALCIDAEAGLLLTAAANLHGGAETGTVLIGDGVSCRVLAIDHGLDLALLQADSALALGSVTWGGEDLPVGAAVAVVAPTADGNGLLTTGVVSARDRRRNQAPLPLAQTDALANYASLGGAVVDADGAVAGLVVMLGPRRGWPWLINSGVTVFVDAQAISAVLPELREGRSISPSRMVGLGVVLQGSGSAEGLRISSVHPGTGAEGAGLLPGDRILSIEGRPVMAIEDLGRVLVRRRAGDSVTLGIERAGEARSIAVELGVFDAR